MATLLPDLSIETHHTTGFRKEIEVLQQLHRSLPAGYTIFHNVDWHSLYVGRDTHGEIDIIVMNQAGDLLLVEVKSGMAVLENGRLYKSYQNRDRDVVLQMRVQYAAMRHLLQKAGLMPKTLCNCIILPDWRITGGAIVAIPRERILDADDYGQLSDRIQSLLPLGASEDGLAERVYAFLSNHLSVAQDVSALQGQLRDTARHLSDGLAIWVPRMQAPSKILRVQATAGSGKTQLALSLLQDAHRRELQAQYVCFNRPLADHIARLTGRDKQVSTFHALCISTYLAKGHSPNGYQPSTYEQAAAVYLESLSATTPDLDLLVIDEAQDFDPAWVMGLMQRLKPDGMLYVLEDADQLLYPRPSLLLPDAVLVHCHDNFRSPRQVCESINAFGLASKPIRARSAWSGELPSILEYDGSRTDLLAKTAQAIRAQIAQGIAPEAMAVLSMRGHGQSELIRCDELAGLPVRRFTGDYLPDGMPLWSDGRLLVESVYRFKGQSVASVIVSEADFERLGPNERARLFVGMTRAWYAVTLVVSSRTAAQLTQALQEQ